MSRPDFSDAVSDIQALLGDAGPTVASLDDAGTTMAGPDDAGTTIAGLDDATPARLMRIRQAIVAQPRTSGHGRTWWPGRPQRKRRRVVLGCIAVPALLAATAAGWAIAASPPASHLTMAVVCYSLPHLPEPGIPESAAGGTDPGLSPTAFCAPQWAAGDVVSGVHRVPASLVACANPALGEVAVFPDTTCAAAHLPPLPAGYGEASRQFYAMESALITELTGSGSQSRCVSEPAAVSFTRQALRSYGFSSWRIIPPQRAGGQLCWQAQPDPATHTIQIVPQPGVYPPSVARVEQVIRETLSVPAGACRSGSTPENAASTIRKLVAALQRAGYGTWKVTLQQPATSQLPCYEEVQYPPGDHSVLLTPVAMAASTY
jgi:hypothetical protein